MTTSPLPHDEVLLFAYSTGDGEAGLKLAASDDGYTFRALNRGKGLWTGTVGAGRRVQSPSIHLGPDGTLHCVWSPGRDESAFGYCRTRDLQTWTPQRLIRPQSVENASGAAYRSPRLAVDEEFGHFLLCWIAEPKNGSTSRDVRPELNRATTTDFEHFESARAMIATSTAITQATLARDEIKDRWAMFLTGADNQGGVAIAASRQLHGEYEMIRPSFVQADSSSSTAAVRLGDRWFCYIARNARGAATLMTSSDLHNWADESDRLSLPHGCDAGSVVAVPRQLLRCI